MSGVFPTPPTAVCPEHLPFRQVISECATDLFPDRLSHVTEGVNENPRIRRPLDGIAPSQGERR